MRHTHILRSTPTVMNHAHHVYRARRDAVL